MSTRALGVAVILIAIVCFLIARGNSYQIFVIVTVGLTAIVGIGLNVLLGLNGQISLGHVAFYAIGAYTVGILTTAHQWSFWPALLASAVISGLAGVLLGIPALRVRGPYLAMVTIAFGLRNLSSRERGLLELQRVLKPGGILVCQLRGVSPVATELRPGLETWTGCWFSAQEIVEFAAAQQFPLVSITGIGTQYTMTVFRKRLGAQQQLFNDCGVFVQSGISFVVGSFIAQGQ